MASGRLSKKARLARMVLLLGALVVAVFLAKRWPKDQTLHFMLGDAAPRVTDIDARLSPGIASSDWVRETSFHYDLGQAPRVVTQVPRLADGDYTVEIEIQAQGGPTVIRKHVTLAGGSTSIELASMVP